MFKPSQPLSRSLPPVTCDCSHGHIQRANLQRLLRTVPCAAMSAAPMPNKSKSALLLVAVNTIFKFGPAKLSRSLVVFP